MDTTVTMLESRAVIVQLVQPVSHQVMYRRHRRAKYLRITVERDGSVVVTLPRRATRAQAEEFLKQKSDWISQRRQELASRPTHPDLDNYSREHYLEHREKARLLLREKVELWNQQYGFVYGRISVKAHKTCWGSCSSKKNLNFNYKILFLPERLQDYIVVHELCHLAEMNHGPRFWQSVAKTIPDYEQIRRELRDLGRGSLD